MEEKKKDSWKKKTAVGMVAAATSASVLVGGAFDSPADLLNPDSKNGVSSPTPIVETLTYQNDSTGDDGNGDEERRQRAPLGSVPAGGRACPGLSPSLVCRMDPHRGSGAAVAGGYDASWQQASCMAAGGRRSRTGLRPYRQSPLSQRPVEEDPAPA